MVKRRKFSIEFKAKLALEALSGELTLAELTAFSGKAEAGKKDSDARSANCMPRSAIREGTIELHGHGRTIPEAPASDARGVRRIRALHDP